MAGIEDKAAALAAQHALASATPKLRPGAPASPESVRKSAEDFTAFFFTQSLESMFSTLGGEQLFGGGTSENIYRSLMLQEYGKVAARSGAYGVTDAVQRQIVALQEMQ
jgi:Rod binding domain-containing protein